MFVASESIQSEMAMLPSNGRLLGRSVPTAGPITASANIKERGEAKELLSKLYRHLCILYATENADPCIIPHAGVGRGPW